jgi:two-component system sporulation sensor kinase B
MASDELARVSRIVRQSLSYYRIAAVAKELDLALLLGESLEVLKERFRRSAVEVSCNFKTPAVIVGYGDEVWQAIDNLLHNSLEAMRKGGRISTSIRLSRSWDSRNEAGVRLTIGDNGCGILKQNLSQISEAFFTTKAEKGTRLGLWVVLNSSLLLSPHAAPGGAQP